MQTTPRFELINNCVGQLAQSLNGVKKPIDVEPLREFYKKGEYREMFKLVRNAMGLDMRLVVGYWNNGPSINPARVYIGNPRLLPKLGSKDFREIKITVLIKNKFLKSAPFESVVLAMSHEMAHVVLAALRHPLNNLANKDDLEVATDITAMMLGFVDMFESGYSYDIFPARVTLASDMDCPIERALRRLRTVNIKSDELVNRIRLGNLSSEELAHAVKTIHRKINYK